MLTLCGCTRRDAGEDTHYGWQCVGSHQNRVDALVSEKPRKFWMLTWGLSAQPDLAAFRTRITNLRVNSHHVREAGRVPNQRTVGNAACSPAADATAASRSREHAQVARRSLRGAAREQP